MAESDKVFAGSIPEIYDRLFVPLIFEPYAEDLAARVAAIRPMRVLELAAGTGVVTRALAARLPAEARIIATDLNQPMLDQAAARQKGDARIVWQQADAQTLPFEDRSFDAVVCQFGVMFFPDRVNAYRETLRVLKPGGGYFFNAWDRIADNEFADVVTEAVAALFPSDPPRFLARTPHGYHDADQIRADVSAAGFGAITLETIEYRSRAKSPLDPAIAYCQGSPLRNEIEARDKAGLDRATKAAAAALARRFGAGAIDGRIQAHVVVAMRAPRELI